MKKYLILISILFVFISNVQSQNIVNISENENESSFDDEFVVNDEFRKLRKEDESLSDDITALQSIKYEHYIKGFICEYSTTTAIKVSPGIVEINGTLYETTADTTVDLTSLSNGWCYIYAYVSSDSLVFKGTNIAPNKNQYNSGTDGVLRYYNTDRCIMAVLKASDVVVMFYQQGIYVQFDTFQSVTAGATATANIPAISTLGYFELTAVGSGVNVRYAHIKPAGSSGDTFNCYSSTSSSFIVNKYFKCATNSSQQISYTETIIGGGATTCKTVGYWINVLN